MAAIYTEIALSKDLAPMNNWAEVGAVEIGNDRRENGGLVP